MPEFYCRAALRSVDGTSGVICVNVLHYIVAPLTSPLDPADAAADIWGQLGTSYTALVSNVSTILDVTVTVETYPDAVPAQGVHNVNAAGTRSVSSRELRDAYVGLISWRTATPKRYARGHMFAPPALDKATLNSSGEWATGNAYWVQMNNFASAYIAGFTQGDTDYVPIIFSKAQVQRSADEFFFPVTGTIVQSVPTYLRSRRT